MFSDNQKISMRQTFRLFVFDFIGISTLLVPTFLAGMNGVYGIASIVAGGILSLIYLCYLGIVIKGMKTDLFSFLQGSRQFWLVRILYGILAVSCVMTAAFTAHTFTSLIRRSLIREESYVLILVLLLVVSGYVVKGGIESRARIYEVLFWIILVPLFIMLFLSVSGVDISYFKPVESFSPVEFGKGSYLVFLFFMTSFFTLLFPASMSQKATGKDLIKCVGCALVCSVGILLVLYLILLGTFGEGSLAKMEFPSITLMSTVQITGGFVKRLDAVMLAVWFFTLYALLNLNVHYGAKFAEKMVGAAGNKRYIGVILILVFGACLLLSRSSEVISFFQNYFWYVAAPLYILVPGILLLRSRMKKPGKIKGGLLLGVLLPVVMVLLSGCKTAELEDKSFPLMAILDFDEEKGQVGFAYIFPHPSGKSDVPEDAKDRDVPMVYGRNFPDALEKYENRLNKEADYNHLKVIVMEDDFVENTEVYESMLDWCLKQESYPRNTYMCITEDIEELQEAKENLSDDLGTYVEQLLENHEYGKERELPTLGDLIDAKENGGKSWQVPLLGVEEDTVIWSGQYEIGSTKKKK